MPKVSVIVPVYGVEKYIERCARSLFEQTLDDIEYIFVDDCTPDRSVEIIKQVLEEYPQRRMQVIIHRMEQNSGQAKVREWGIKNATGEYVIHCDSDDWVDHNIFRMLYEKATESEADMVICDYYKANSNVQELIDGCYCTEKEMIIRDLLLEKISWALWNKLIKTSLYQAGEIQCPKENMGEDMALIMQLVIKANKIVHCPTPLYYYFFNPISITHKQSEEAIYRRFQQLKNNTDIVLNAFENNKLNYLYKKELLSLKWSVRRCIWMITKKKKYRDIWEKTYPEIFPKILFSPFVRVIDKIKIILTYLSLYP